MARVVFTSHLARHVACPEERADGGTLGEVLAAYFARHPTVKSYVLDDQGTLRGHVAIFIDGVQARDRRGLSDATSSDAEVYVMQALSGG